MKHEEIEIETWTTTAGCDFKYAARGHHDAEAFRAAVQKYLTDNGCEPIEEDIDARRKFYLIDHETGLADLVPSGTPGAAPYTETQWDAQTPKKAKLSKEATRLTPARLVGAAARSGRSKDPAVYWLLKD